MRRKQFELLKAVHDGTPHSMVNDPLARLQSNGYVTLTRADNFRITAVAITDFALYVDHPGGMTSRLLWERPDTRHYGIDFLIHGRHLFVTGDLGEAIYSFSEALSLERLAQYDLGYFHGKLSASRNGAHGKVWDELAAEQQVERLFRENDEEYARELSDWELVRDDERAGMEEDGRVWSDEEYERENPKPVSVMRYRFRDLGGPNAFGSADGWMQWLDGPAQSVRGPRDNDDTDTHVASRAHAVFGTHYYDHLYGIGYRMDYQTVWHYTGLQMAIKQLRERQEVPA